MIRIGCHELFGGGELEPGSTFNCQRSRPDDISESDTWDSVSEIVVFSSPSSRISA
jgi:hypothetical protein